MGNELVHHHDFHSIQFQNFNVKERNVIYALCYKVMNQGTDLLEFSVKEIEKLANYTPREKGDNVYKLMEEVYDRVKNASIKIKKENGIKAFVLFTKFETFEDKGIIQIKVNEEYRYLLNELAAPFTIQNVIEYSQLLSGYSQLAYSFLKKWEGTKKIEISIIEFKELLGVPSTFDSSNFNRIVLAPIERDLPQYFYKFKLEKIKTGKKNTHLKFTWRNKPLNSNQEVINIEVSQELQATFEKALKNRFIKEFLTEENKHKLITSFDEKDLIKGLRYAKENINYSFKTFSYLENSIKKGLEKPTIKTTIIKTNVPEEKNIILGEQLSIKTKVTKEEYEECYQEYLKINNAKDSKQIRKSWELSVKNKFEIIEKNKDDDGNNFTGNNSELIDEKDRATMYKKYLEKYNLVDSEIEKKVYNDIITGYQIENPLKKNMNPIEVFEYFGIEFNNRKRKEYTEELPRLKQEEEMTEKVKHFQKLLLEKSYELKTKIKQAGVFSKSKLTKEFNEFEHDRLMFNKLADINFLDDDKALFELDRLHEKFKNIIGISLENIHLDRKLEKIINYPCDIIQDDTYHSLTIDKKKEYLIKKVKFSEIPKENLLSKNGKILVGGALISRLRKIAKELESSIELPNGKIIIY